MKNLESKIMDSGYLGVDIILILSAIQKE